MHPDDERNLCGTILTRDLGALALRLACSGLWRRGADLLPGVAHPGQAASFVLHAPGRMQLHVVLYPSPEGYLVAAHWEPDEVLDLPGHLVMAASHRTADYKTGTEKLYRLAYDSALPFVPRPRRGDATRVPWPPPPRV